MGGGIFCDGVGAKGGINWDGNRSREKNPSVRDEESPRSRQHHRYAPACGYSTPRQLRGAAVPSGVELAKGQRKAAFPGFAIFGDEEVRTLAVLPTPQSQSINNSST